MTQARSATGKGAERRTWDALRRYPAAATDVHEPLHQADACGISEAATVTNSDDDSGSSSRSAITALNGPTYHTAFFENHRALSKLHSRDTHMGWGGEDAKRGRAPYLARRKSHAPDASPPDARPLFGKTLSLGRFRFRRRRSATPDAPAMRVEVAPAPDAVNDADGPVNHSIYLDGQYSGFAAGDGAGDGAGDATAGDGSGSSSAQERVSAQTELQGKRVARAERAQRAAEEQATWVRQKFSLPESEELLASFSAALVKSILLQGRLHIMTSHICFYAKIFGKVTKECYSFADMAGVKKRKSGFIANAIKISFLDESISPVVIGSLNRRERAFNLIQSRLRDLNPAASQEIDISSAPKTGSSHGDESEDQSQDGDEVFHPAVGVPSATQSESGTSAARVANGKDSDFVDVGPDGVIDVSSAEHVPSPEPELVWATAEDVVDRVAGHEYGRRTEQARGVLNAPVKVVFNLIFVNDWVKRYHDASSNYDVTVGQWARAPDGFMTREVGFRRALGYRIGPKETRVKETQRYSFSKAGGVIVEIEGHSLDAPFGDYFRIETYFELKPHGPDGAQCEMVASLAVYFMKSTMLRSKIESGALAETKVTFNTLLGLAAHSIEEANTARRTTIGSAIAGLNKRPNHNIAAEATDPCSPTKRARQSGKDANVPATVQIPVMERLSPTRATPSFSVVPPVSTPVTKERPASQLLQMIAIAVLVVVSLVLCVVVALLFKMHHEVTVLEKLVVRTQEQAAAMMVAGAEVCAAPQA